MIYSFYLEYKFSEIKIDYIKYLDYKNFIDFLCNNIKDNNVKKLIVNKINYNIKSHICNMDDFYLKIINKFRYCLQDYKFPVIIDDKYIDIQLDSFYISKKYLKI